MRRSFKPLKKQRSIRNWSPSASKSDAQSDLISRYGMFPKSQTALIKNIVTKAKDRGINRLAKSERNKMVGIALDYAPARLRLRVMGQADREARIVSARAQLQAAGFPDSRLSLFDENRYVPAFNLSENIFFGPLRQDRRDAFGSFAEQIDKLAADSGLREMVVHEGLAQQTGDGGVALNAQQKRKLALARALIKRPCALVLDGIAATASPADTALRQTLRSALGTGALVFGVNRADPLPNVDYMITLDERHTIAITQGPPPMALPNTVLAQ
jgi:putative ABC transport system ATP-binding protein